jgi:hypothetical protein
LLLVMESIEKLDLLSYGRLEYQTFLLLKLQTASPQRYSTTNPLTYSSISTAPNMSYTCSTTTESYGQKYRLRTSHPLLADQVLRIADTVKDEVEVY